jgi:hypothetical protein
MESRAHVLLLNGLPVDESSNLIPVVYVQPECPKVEKPYFWVGWCPFCGSRLEHAGTPDSEGWLGLFAAKCGNEGCPCRRLGYYVRVCPRI